MSTQHNLIEKDGILVELDEKKAGQFDLVIYSVDNSHTTDNLSEIGSTGGIFDGIDLIRIAVRLLQIALPN